MNIMKQQIEDLFTNPIKTMENSLWFSGIKDEGEFKIWHNNSRLFVHGFYKEGLRDGEYKSFSDSGKLGMHCFYKNHGKYTIEEAKVKFPEGPWL